MIRNARLDRRITNPQSEVGEPDLVQVPLSSVPEICQDLRHAQESNKLFWLRPLKRLIRPLKGLIRPLRAYKDLKGLIRPLKGFIRPLKAL